MGIPAVVVTALPTIAVLSGANRIVRGIAITNPTGDPSRDPTAETELRARIMDVALALLHEPVSGPTVVGTDA